jgi:RNA polymerase sigma factor (sigma-70 family)
MSNEELCKRIQDGEEELTEQLITQNNGFIYKTAQRYYPSARRYGGVDFDDIEQAAVLGMLEALNKWDAARGSFISIAALCMSGSIRALLGISTSKRGVEHCAQIVSIDSPVSNENETLLVELIPDDTCSDPAERACSVDDRAALRADVERLSHGEKELIYRVYFHGEQWPADPGERRCLIHALNALKRNKQLRSRYADFVASCYRHKGVTAFRNTWTSTVEDAALRAIQFSQRR